MDGFVKVQGKNLVLDGKPVLFHGLGLGSWLNLEHFMLGLPTTDSLIRRAVKEVFGAGTAEQFFKGLETDFIAEEDFRFLADAGIDLVRVPFNYRLFLDDQAPGKWKEEGFAAFERLFGLCEKYHIYVLPDLHTTPGGQNPDWHSDNSTGIPQFWDYKLFRDQMVLLWKTLAGRWKDRRCILGYDILNEPWLMGAPAERLDEFYREATVAIREVDKEHILFLEGDNFAMDFDSFRQPEDENTALTCHFYPTVWEPGLVSSAKDRAERKERFREILGRIISVRDRLGRPMLCGEAGYEIDKNDVPASMALLEDTLDLFDEAGLSWTVWSYKDAQFMSLCFPKPDTPWMRLANKLGKYWSQEIEKAQARRVMEELAGLPGLAEAGDGLQYDMHFRQRGILYQFQYHRLLKPALQALTPEQLLALPQAFRFENCGHHPMFLQLLKTHGKKEPSGKV